MARHQEDSRRELNQQELEGAERASVRARASAERG